MILLCIGASLGLGLLALVLMATSAPVDVGERKSVVPDSSIDMVI
jgi:hypothetical protein